MSRLIDADKLLDDMKNELEKAVNDENLDRFECMVILTSAIALKDFVNRQPTAFNVDKVVEQLEKSHFHTDATFDDDGYCNDDSEEVVNLNEAIEIVRSGGIDEHDRERCKERN